MGKKKKQASQGAQGRGGQKGQKAAKPREGTAACGDLPPDEPDDELVETMEHLCVDEEEEREVGAGEDTSQEPSPATKQKGRFCHRCALE